MDGQTPSIWAKVDFSRPLTPALVASETSRDDTEQKSKWPWVRRGLDTLGTLFWLYLLLKVFVTDLDTALFGDLAQYRFFFFVAVVALMALLFRKTWAILGAFSYVLGFPLVILFWKIPRWIYKSGSPVAFLAVLNAASSLLGDIKRSVIVGALVAFSALGIALSHDRVVLFAAGSILLALLVYTIFRTIKLSVEPTRFIRMQQRGIRTAFDSQAVQALLSPGEELRSSAIEKFNEDQQTEFLNSLGHAVLAQRLLSLWAHFLERYRTSTATILFNFLSYLWLLVRAVLAISFLNLALYHASTTSFTYQAAPSFLVIVRYTLAGLYGGEIQALHPSSDLANALSIANFAVGVVVVGFLALSSFLSYRATRDESDIRVLIEQIKREGDSLDEKLQEDYEVTVPEAIERLRQLRYGLSGVIAALSARIPRDFESDDR